jgi:hypothetical protein
MKIKSCVTSTTGGWCGTLCSTGFDHEKREGQCEHIEDGKERNANLLVPDLTVAAIILSLVSNMFLSMSEASASNSSGRLAPD